MAGSASPLVNSPVNGADWQYATFGPYAATQADTILPFVAIEPVHIGKVSLITRVKPSVASNFNLLARTVADAAVSDTVTAARKVITTVDLNTLTNLTQSNAVVSTDYNQLDPGDSLVADFATTTAMADFYVTIAYQNVRAATRGTA